LPELEYVDEASAKNGDRPQFKRLWADAAAHRFDCLLFWSLDRLTREGTFAMLQYLRRLNDQGIKFKSYTEQYVDSLGVFGEAIIGLLAAVAQQERVRLSERTKAGLARVKAQGKKLGRPTKQFSLAKAQRMRAEGRTLREISKRFKVSPSLLCRELKKQK
jgi:DNA invertase Pin-like site-specific DNA recombinase